MPGVQELLVSRAAADLEDVDEDLRAFAQELRQTVDRPESTST